MKSWRTCLNCGHSEGEHALDDKFCYAFGLDRNVIVCVCTGFKAENNLDRLERAVKEIIENERKRPTLSLWA